MESPIKKLDFGSVNKENQPLDHAAASPEQTDAPHKPAVEETKSAKDAQLVVASAIKPEELDEPLLRENPGRFVLFPIKYHEVSDASRRVEWSLT